MGKTYVVVAEVRGGSLRQVALEALQAVSIAKHDGDSTAAVLIGSQITPLASELANYVEGQVYSIDHPDLEIYNPEAYLNVMKTVFERVTPDVVVLGHTALGRDLGPAIAAHLDAGQISDVTAIEKSGDDVIYTRPLYAGKAFEQKQFTGGTQVVTIRPNNIDPAAASSSPAEIVELEYAPAGSLRSIVKDIVRKTSGKVDLTEAKIVVSGGRGVKSADGFKPLEELADVLHGAVGASRAACDAGYCDYSMQIGQTGKVVTPEIYIACGISGAIQHLAGMSQSRVIIAINKDPEAPIFKVADYGIVGDLFEVVPLLTQEFRKVLV
ncbi:electron transfer flavoprotein subunit alpha/FixB family protein [Paenibacillus sp. HJL G12]|uniref:Electron transfer flavoprotein subunit alpha/FixB family protein n=1 Tax=Paenibacillus dendrobii TaxID=2691084 RepID=A0A7X3IH70_9BACL|nr:electron transfer flavoprotein subunit alpha/FixB family protein [Paenibacillus dendrobii]MWV42450.1 electron transfer flavoprotein subunit alpha/FixB family protein [Paenibacillus dendrobii]